MGIKSLFGLLKTSDARQGETTSLLVADSSDAVIKPAQADIEGTHALLSPYKKVLCATFFLSVSFVFTATPLLFAFRTMECQDYYEHHAPPLPDMKDRCALKQIEASTAASISYMVIFTTASGFLNLLVTTAEIQRWGVRAALVQQTFWPCLRNIIQTISIKHGYRWGINLITYSQMITILGGGAGYMLAANTYISEVVAPEERTAAFGVLSGVAMAGTGFGYTVGGLAGDYISPAAPFEITFCLLVASTLFTGLFLPYIAPVQKEGEKKGFSLGAVLGCLAVFVPRRREGQKGRYWGLTLLGLGTFLGVLATSFVPLMLQLTATNRYSFQPSQNGYLMSLNSLCRALFLTLLFPRIIASGRIWFSPAPPTPPLASETSSSIPSPTPTIVSTTGPLSALPTSAEDFEPSALLGEVEEPVNVPVAMKPTDKAHGSGFDLSFLKWSMVVDGVLTGCVGWNSTAWEILLAAAILPLASGTAPACKGVMMELVPPEERADALSAISLIETAGFIICSSLFGVVFAWLTDIGRPNFIFFFNAGLALLAGLVLLTVRFPRTKPAVSV